jgi:hypothetical protein
MRGRTLRLFVAAVLGVAGTVGAIWSEVVREKFADQRMSDNEAATVRAGAEAAKARSTGDFSDRIDDCAPSALGMWHAIGALIATNWNFPTSRNN